MLQNFNKEKNIPDAICKSTEKPAWLTHERLRYCQHEVTMATSLVTCWNLKQLVVVVTMATRSPWQQLPWCDVSTACCQGRRATGRHGDAGTRRPLVCADSRAWHVYCLCLGNLSRSICNSPCSQTHLLSPTARYVGSSKSNKIIIKAKKLKTHCEVNVISLTVPLYNPCKFTNLIPTVGFSYMPFSFCFHIFLELPNQFLALNPYVEQRYLWVFFFWFFDKSTVKNQSLIIPTLSKQV